MNEIIKKVSWSAVQPLEAESVKRQLKVSGQGTKGKKRKG